MNTIITVNGVDYASADRALNSFDALDELTIVLDGGYGEVVWTISGVRPLPLFKSGMTVTLKTDGTLRFVGNIESIQHHQIETGWAITFRALDLKHRADFATVFGADGGNQATYNRPPTDPLYIPSDAGMSVGAIVARILTIAANASVLNGYGVGAYTGSPPPWVLPAATTTDLAALTVVPPRLVSLGGDGLFAVLEQFIQSWHPKFTLWIQPDGTIRCTNVFTMTTHAIVIPGEYGAADPVSWPQLTRDTAGCFTQVQVTGLSIRPAICSILDGTLAKGWSPTDETNWTLADFQSPIDSTDTGNLSSVTTSTCVVTSDFATAHWATNFWDQSNRLGWITFINPGATGITLHDSRKITSCTALTPGGTATITWDAGDPLDSLSYSRYRIVGTAGPLLDVGRLFTFREPVGPLLGTATYVGSHLQARFPQPMPWSNNGKTFLTSVPVGVVMWSPSGAAPWLEFPVVFDLVPGTGQIRAIQPVVMPFASTATLNKGYPTTFPMGKPYDVKIMVPYNRGLLAATAPGVGAYSGTAYTQDGIQRIKYVPLNTWNYAGDSTNIQALAAELLAVYQDAVVEGTLTYHGIPGAFDPFAMGYALSLTVANATSPWDGLNLPVRAVSLRWPQGGGTLHTVTWHLSNRKRAFQGWDLYVHPIPNHELSDLSGHQSPFDNAIIGETHVLGANAMPGTVLGGAVDNGQGMHLDPAAFTGPGGLGGKHDGKKRPVDPDRDGIPNKPSMAGPPRPPRDPNAPLGVRERDDDPKPASKGTGLPGASIPFDRNFQVPKKAAPAGPPAEEGAPGGRRISVDDGSNP